MHATTMASKSAWTTKGAVSTVSLPSGFSALCKYDSFFTKSIDSGIGYFPGAFAPIFIVQRGPQPQSQKKRTVDQIYFAGLPEKVAA